MPLSSGIRSMLLSGESLSHEHGTLWSNIASSTKLQGHNMLHCCPRMTKPWPRVMLGPFHTGKFLSKVAFESGLLKATFTK